MKIIFPTSKFYPVQSGGPIYTLLWHCTALRNKGVSVSIITTDSGFETIKGMKPAVNKNLSYDFGNIVYTSGYFQLLKQLVIFYKNLKDSEVVHLNSFFSPISFFSFLLLKLIKSNRTIVWSIRGEFSESALSFNSKKKNPVIRLIRPFTKNVIFHCTSQQEYSDIIKILGNRKIVNIPNLMEFPKHFSTIKENKFLFIGRIHPIKKIENLLEALKLSTFFKDSDYGLIIAGNYENRYSQYYKELIRLVKINSLEEKVTFQRHVINEEKWRLFSSSKFTILPSMSENFGNVIVESLSQGTPAIASTGTPWEELVRAEAGFHVDNDPITLAKVIDEVIKMPNDTYEQFCLNARNLADKRFNIHKKIDEWINVYSAKKE